MPLRVRMSEHWRRFMDCHGKKRALPTGDAPAPQRLRIDSPASLERVLADSVEAQERREAADLEQALIQSNDDEARRRFASEQ